VSGTQALSSTLHSEPETSHVVDLNERLAPPSRGFDVTQIDTNRLKLKQVVP
jgi:hypothetical protein